MKRKARKERCSSKLFLIVGIAIACSLYFLFLLFPDDEPVPFELSSSFDIDDAPSKLYGVCPLPRRSVFAPTIAKEEKQCNSDVVPLSVLNSEGRVIVNPAVRDEADRIKSCFARPLHDATSWPWTWWRAVAVFFSRNRYLFWYNIEDAGKITDDFVEVECPGYKNVHGRVRRRREIPKRANNAPDVYIIHVRSLKSNLFSHQTTRYLEEALDAVHFHNYQSLGDDYADLAAMLSGGLAVPLSKERMGSQQVATNAPRNSRDDPCFLARTNTYLPRLFQQRGYATLIADENNIRESGFERGCGWEPSNIYSPVLREHPPEPGCSFADRALEYFKRFTIVYDDSAKFVTLQILHNDGVVDDELLAFFKGLKLHNAYVFFIADAHGDANPTRIPTPRQNLWVSVPDRLKDSIAIARLIGNQHALVSPFDVHATLRDIAGLSSSKSGSSLLGKLPSTVRDCARLPIPLQHCPCPVGVVNYTDTATLFEASEAALEPLSDLLSRLNCKRWDIERILAVRRLELLPLVEVFVAVRPMERNGFFSKKYDRLDFPVFELLVEETRTASSLVFTGLPSLSVALKPIDHSLSTCASGHWLRPFCYCESWMM